MWRREERERRSHLLIFPAAAARASVTNGSEASANEILGPAAAAGICTRRSAMDTRFGAEQDQLRKDLRELLDATVPPGWVGIWHDNPDALAVSERANSALAERGWLTYYWPAEYGGSAGSIWDQLVIQEELFARHEPRGGEYMGVNWIGPALIRFGTQRQKDRYLPQIARGRGRWAQLFSEPDAGSDLAGVRTYAEPDGDHFVVNGEKTWTSYANTAENGVLLARTDRGAQRHRGLSVLLVDMTGPGIEVREIPTVIGWHRLHSVHFHDVRVPREALLGPENDGWAVAMAALPFERIGNARYARTTRILGYLESLPEAAEAPYAHIIGDALALGRSAELMNYRAAELRDRNGDSEPLGWEASAAFALNASYEQRVAAIAEQLLGMRAFVATPDPLAPAAGEVESFVALQAPTVKIQAGTYQMQLSIIAQAAMGLPRAR
jgi:alkylation response protein AidB-like acyl-CoA dehydrogenase